MGANPPSKLIVTGVASLPAVRIAEDMRCVLDRSVSALSAANCPECEGRGGPVMIRLFGASSLWSDSSVTWIVS